MNPEPPTDQARPLGDPRSVLLPILLGQILGYTVALHLPLASWMPATAFALAALLWVLRHHRRVAMPGVAPALVTCSTLLIAVCWFHLRNPPLAPDWEWLPPREIEATVRLSRTFRWDPETGSFNGLGIILAENLPADNLVGQRVSLSMRGLHTALDGQRHSIARVRGVVEPVTKVRADTDSFAGFLRLSRIHFAIRQARVLEAEPPASGWRAFSHRLYTRINQRLSHPDEIIESRLLRATTLGRRDLLSEEERGRFLLTGTAHLFAISGLHVSIIATAAACAAGLSRLPSWAGLLATAVVSGIYVEITGATPSGLRAWIMVMIFMAAHVLLRQRNPFAALVASAVITLWIDPLQLLSAGFQFSYAVVAMIILYGIPLQNRLAQSLRTALARQRADLRPAPDSRWIVPVRLFAISLAAALGGTPLSVLHFGIFAPAGLLLNLLLLPAASFAVLAAALGAALDLSGLALPGAVFVRAAWFIMRLMNLLCSGVASSLGSGFPPLHCPTWLAILALALLLFLGILRPLRAHAPARAFLLAPALVALFLATALTL